jgi:hypothetical protein
VRRPGIEEMPTAIIAFVRPGPSANTAISARTSDGNASRMSTMRMMTASTRPPRYPASTPSSTPRLIAMATEMMPSRNEMRAPKITRLITSRPSVSVPIQWSADGGIRALMGSTASGS